nr:hypothetical protein [Tanacetum cinerariifolium]
GFDDEGSQFDAKGNLHEWWSKEDRKRFNERVAVIVKQFNSYTLLDSLHINGKATAGENIADLGGIVIGLDAFKKTKQYKEGKKINGLTPVQRYFLGYALGWQMHVRDESLASQLLTDVHSPAQYRVNGPMADVPAFYEAFGVKPGQKLYIPDSARVKICRPRSASRPRPGPRSSHAAGFGNARPSARRGLGPATYPPRTQRKLEPALSADGHSAVYLARLYLRQLWSLGPSEEEDADDLNQLKGSRPAKYLALNVGKFSIADYFDQNSYSHDPRTQFFNWSLMSAGGWDYPANVRGYTVGAVVEYVQPGLALRAGVSSMPTDANGPTLDFRYGKAQAITAEVTKSYAVNGHPGAVRLLGFRNQAAMGSYNLAVHNVAGLGSVPDVTGARAERRTKYG